MNTITTFEKGSYPYEMLEKACAILTATSKNGTIYMVEDTYFDYGQNWMWTTIIAHNPNSMFGSYQAINPRNQEEIIESDDLLATIAEIKKDKYFNDK